MGIKINVLKILASKLQGLKNNNIVATYKASKDSIQEVILIADNKGILPVGSIPTPTQQFI